ncbi:hypothetical protein D3C78_1454290 [compost metagenome]
MRLRKLLICGDHGLRSRSLENSLGSGYSPGNFRKASSSVPTGELRTTTGSRSGAVPGFGAGKPPGGGEGLGSRGTGPNSSNNISVWVNGWAPNSGLGRPLVGMLNEVCWAGGRTLFASGVLRLPGTPPACSNEPLFAGVTPFSS